MLLIIYDDLEISNGHVHINFDQHLILLENAGCYTAICKFMEITNKKDRYQFIFDDFDEVMQIQFARQNKIKL